MKKVTLKKSLIAAKPNQIKTAESLGLRTTPFWRARSGFSLTLSRSRPSTTDEGGIRE